MKALDEAIRGFQLTIEVHRTTSQRGSTKMTKLPFCRDSARNLAIAVELKLGDWTDNFFLPCLFVQKRCASREVISSANPSQ